MAPKFWNEHSYFRNIFRHGGIDTQNGFESIFTTIKQTSFFTCSAPQLLTLIVIQPDSRNDQSWDDSMGGQSCQI